MSNEKFQSAIDAVRDALASGDMDELRASVGVLFPMLQEMDSAPGILTEAITTLAQRGKERDQKQERSMGRIVRTFNALTGHDITEADGWAFMVCLKLARYYNGKKKQRDSFVDGAAYFGLMGEAVERE